MELIQHYGPWMLLGFMLSQLGDLLSSGIKLSEFNAKKWVDDNLLQVVFSLVCMMALLALGDTLYPLVTGQQLTANTAFWAGLGSDAITNYFMRRKRKQSGV